MTRRVAEAPPGSSRAKVLGCRCPGPDKDGLVWLAVACRLHSDPVSPHYAPPSIEFVEATDAS